MSNLDDIDLKIIDLLREDGRMNIRTLAESVDLPETTARDRLHRLERDHFIRGYKVLVDSRAVGAPVQALVLLDAPKGKTDDTAHGLWSDPAVLDGHALAERPNGFCIRIGAQNTQRLARTLDRWRHDLDIEVKEMLLLDDFQSTPVDLDGIEWEHAVLKTLRTPL